MKFAWMFIACAVFSAVGMHIRAGEHTLAEKLVGEWEGPRHIRAFYADGSFTLDPHPGGKPLGRWSLKNHTLTTVFDEDPTPLVQRIVKITDSEMVIVAYGIRYTYKRVRHQ